MEKEYLIHNIELADNPGDQHITMDLKFSDLQFQNNDLTSDVEIDFYENGYLAQSDTYDDVSLTGAGGGGGGTSPLLLAEKTYTIENGDTSTTSTVIDTFSVTNDNIQNSLKENGILIISVERTNKITSAFYGSTTIIPFMNSQTTFNAGYAYKITSENRAWLTDGRMQYGLYIKQLSVDYDNNIISIDIAKKYDASYTPNWDNATYNVKIYIATL